MEAGADANSLSNLGLTPLQAAIAHGQLACARELIPLTDLLHFSADGNNALHTSIMLKQPKIFKLLLPHFADNVDVRSIKNQKSRPVTLTVRTMPRRCTLRVRVVITLW